MDRVYKALYTEADIRNVEHNGGLIIAYLWRPTFLAQRNKPFAHWLFQLLSSKVVV